jgi:hypothetical protein
MRLSVSDRFWSKVTKTEQCWLWLGAPTSSGYGAIEIEGKTISAHRYSYEYEYGSIPVGRFVLHTCDIPLCVRPSHLYSGTHKDNMRDMLERGHHKHPSQRGELNSRAKITMKDAEDIRRDYATGKATHRSLGVKYGIDHTSICRIVNGRYWVVTSQTP